MTNSQMSASMNELDRDVWCVLGLPFDAVTMSSSVNRVYQSVKNKTPCFISTPNLNFVIASQNEIDFRDSVIFSDLSIADGMPLIWVAKFLGIPLNERVPGSGLIEELCENEHHKIDKINIFFFGGMEGIAEQACENLNHQNGPMKCVGSYNPGFGTVEEMSRNDVIDKINRSAADFVIVSLGAKKGQAWIMNNKQAIHAPVVSHLGAVVNFVAGNVNRSPVLLQKIGLEWLWRIYQEPSLWKRYLKDGIGFLKLIITRIIPYKLFCLFNSPDEDENDNSIRLVNENGTIELILKGAFTKKNNDSLRQIFINAVKSGGDIRINLKDVTFLDSSVIGLMLVLLKLIRKSGYSLSILNSSKKIKRIFFYNCASYLLIP